MKNSKRYYQITTEESCNLTEENIETELPVIISRQKGKTTEELRKDGHQVSHYTVKKQLFLKGVFMMILRTPRDYFLLRV